eukprot:2151907-Prymnesium_polylepis.1
MTLRQPQQKAGNRTRRGRSSTAAEGARRSGGRRPRLEHGHSTVWPASATRAARAAGTRAEGGERHRE